jgi:hypothetical protein
VAGLDAQIAAAEAELKRLKFKRRATLAGRASGRARKHSPQALALRASYAAEGGGYGRVRQLAREIGISERQAHRILKDLKPGNGSALNVTPCEPSPGDGAASRSVSALASATATSSRVTSPASESAERVGAGDRSLIPRKRRSDKQGLPGNGTGPSQTGQFELPLSPERSSPDGKTP